MAITIQVDGGVLLDAQQAWRRTVDDLAGAGLRLGQVTGAGLAPGVAGEVDRFVGAWHTVLLGLVAQAGQEAGAFALAGADLRICDEDQARRIRGLLGPS